MERNYHILSFVYIRYQTPLLKNPETSHWFWQWFGLCSHLWRVKTTKAPLSPICCEVSEQQDKLHTKSESVWPRWLIFTSWGGWHCITLQKQDFSKDNVALPKISTQGFFTTLVWDNIDLVGETTSGQGISHWVNEIVVERLVLQQFPPDDGMPSHHKV